MDGTVLSFFYAAVNIGASYGLNMRLRCGPYLGIAGSILGFGVGLLTDATGLLLNTPVYFVMGIIAIRSGGWAKEPWFRKRKETE